MGTGIGSFAVKKQISPGRERNDFLDDKIRWFLVIWTAVLTLLIIATYLITRDSVVLGTTVVFSVAITSVFAYYFPRKSE